MLLKTERTIASWVLSAPLLLLLASLLIWPLVLGVQTAFSRDRLSEFEVTAAGLDNFITLLNAPNFWSSLGFTLSYAVIVTSLEIVLGFTLALLFDRASMDLSEPASALGISAAGLHTRTTTRSEEGKEMRSPRAKTTIGVNRGCFSWRLRGGQMRGALPGVCKKCVL